jgi:hypothetical protein
MRFINRDGKRTTVIAPEETATMTKKPEPIQSGSKTYPVGRRGSYVYFLLQGETDLAKRAEDRDKWIKEFSLTTEEIAALDQSLGALDARREAKRNAPPPPPPPPPPRVDTRTRRRSNLRPCGKLACPATSTPSRGDRPGPFCSA